MEMSGFGGLKASQIHGNVRFWGTQSQSNPWKCQVLGDSKPVKRHFCLGWTDCLSHDSSHVVQTPHFFVESKFFSKSVPLTPHCPQCKKSEGLAYGHIVRGLYGFWYEFADACAQQR
jgi:hypothetical protein